MIKTSHEKDFQRSDVIFFYDDINPKVRSVRFLLNKLGLNIQNKFINLIKGQHLIDAYKQINPGSGVPTLIDAELVLYNAPSILLHLSIKYDDSNDNKLFPKSIYSQMKILNILILDLTFLYRSHVSYMYALIRKDHPVNIDECYGKQIFQSYQVIENLLSNQRFIALETLTIADYMVLGTVTGLDLLYPLKNYCSKFPKLYNWFCNLKLSPEFDHSIMAGIERERYFIDFLVMKQSLDENENKNNLMTQSRCLLDQGVEHRTGRGDYSFKIESSAFSKPNFSYSMFTKNSSNNLSPEIFSSPLPNNLTLRSSNSPKKSVITIGLKKSDSKNYKFNENEGHSEECLKIVNTIANYNLCNRFLCRKRDSKNSHSQLEKLNYSIWESLHNKEVKFLEEDFAVGGENLHYPLCFYFQNEAIICMKEMKKFFFERNSGYNKFFTKQIAHKSFHKLLPKLLDELNVHPCDPSYKVMNVFTDFDNDLSQLFPKNNISQCDINHGKKPSLTKFINEVRIAGATKVNHFNEFYFKAHSLDNLECVSKYNGLHCVNSKKNLMERVCTSQFNRMCMCSFCQQNLQNKFDEEFFKTYLNNPKIGLSDTNSYQSFLKVEQCNELERTKTKIKIGFIGNIQRKSCICSQCSRDGLLLRSGNVEKSTNFYCSVFKESYGIIFSKISETLYSNLKDCIVLFADDCDREKGGMEAFSTPFNLTCPNIYRHSPVNEHYVDEKPVIKVTCSNCGRESHKPVTNTSNEKQNADAFKCGISSSLAMQSLSTNCYYMDCDKSGENKSKIPHFIEKTLTTQLNLGSAKDIVVIYQNTSILNKQRSNGKKNKLKDSKELYKSNYLEGFKLHRSRNNQFSAFHCKKLNESNTPQHKLSEVLMSPRKGLRLNEPLTFWDMKQITKKLNEELFCQLNYDTVLVDKCSLNQFQSYAELETAKKYMKESSWLDESRMNFYKVRNSQNIETYYNFDGKRKSQANFCGKKLDSRNKRLLDKSLRMSSSSKIFFKKIPRNFKQYNFHIKNRTFAQKCSSSVPNKREHFSPKNSLANDSFCMKKTKEDEKTDNKLLKTALLPNGCEFSKKSKKKKGFKYPTEFCKTEVTKSFYDKNVFLPNEKEAIKISDKAEAYKFENTKKSNRGLDNIRKSFNEITEDIDCFKQYVKKKGHQVAHKGSSPFVACPSSLHNATCDDSRKRKRKYGQISFKINKQYSRSSIKNSSKATDPVEVYGNTSEFRVKKVLKTDKLEPFEKNSGCTENCSFPYLRAYDCPWYEKDITSPSTKTKEKHRKNHSEEVLINADHRGDGGNIKLDL